jgi:phosphotransferase system IIB component
MFEIVCPTHIHLQMQNDELITAKKLLEQIKNDSMAFMSMASMQAIFDENVKK